MRGDSDCRTRLSWWFPQIPSSIPIPETIVIQHEGEDLINLLDGQVPTGFSSLCIKLNNAGNKLGWPFFLRTDYLSGKHFWKDTCHVATADDVPKHVSMLVQESHMADMMGFPTDLWIDRRLIPTEPAFFAFGGDMPIVKERRYFMRDAHVLCHHPYWLSDVFRNCNISTDDWPRLLEEMNSESDQEVGLLSELSSMVGAAIGGSWSIDWLWSEEECKWYLTDMAEAEQSYHWPECPDRNKM